MAEYIVWAKQGGNCWERHDADMLELAKLIRDQQRRLHQREVLLTRVIQDDGFVERADTPAEAESAPATGETIAAGGPGDPPVPEAVSEPQADVEIQVLGQLKSAFESLDQQTVWRVAHWAIEYARQRQRVS